MKNYEADTSHINSRNRLILNKETSTNPSVSFVHALHIATRSLLIYFTCLFEGLHWDIMQKQGVLSLSFVVSVQWREDLDFKRSQLCTIKGKARAQPRIREPDLSGLTWSEATGWCRWRVSCVNEWTITNSSIRFKYKLYIIISLS